MSATTDVTEDRKWEGYSDYELVSKLITTTVSECVGGYAAIQSHQAEGAKIKPEQAAQERSSILQAAIRLRVELRAQQETEERYQEILDEWDGEDGYLNQFRELKIANGSGMPAWVSEFVEQIVEAAFKLGYLQAGRTAKKEPDDPVERDTENMFKGV